MSDAEWVDTLQDPHAYWNRIDTFYNLDTAGGQISVSGGPVEGVSIDDIAVSSSGSGTSLLEGRTVLGFRVTANFVWLPVPETGYRRYNFRGNEADPDDNVYLTPGSGSVSREIIFPEPVEVVESFSLRESVFFAFVETRYSGFAIAETSSITITTLDVLLLKEGASRFWKDFRFTREEGI